jgi:hypothetical protein
VRWRLGGAVAGLADRQRAMMVSVHEGFFERERRARPGTVD